MDCSSVSSSLLSLSTIDSNDPTIIELKTKVNRKMLETMLNGGDSGLASAEDFFVKIANESGAIVVYPRKGFLHRIAHKEPEINLIGTSCQVQTAKNLILSSIGPYKNRVTLKMDISHADHSHIIGKGGKRVSSIMSLTETHIHFPDCNRVENEAKSNQVTIASKTLQKAEEARMLLRQHMPLTTYFFAELNDKNVEYLNPNHPHMKYYQKRYNVLISFKVSQPNAIGKRIITVQFRGTRLDFDNLTEAARNVYNHLNLTSVGFNSSMFVIEVHISAQHHSFVMGRGQCNVTAINERTGAQVIFPDFSTSPEKPKLDETVIIRGRGIESAYLAWLDLLGYLPLTMIFSVGPEVGIDSHLIQNLMSANDLQISIRQKTETGNKLLVLKTRERHSWVLFDARHKILNIKELPPVVAQPHRKAKTLQISENLTKNFPCDFTKLEVEVLRGFEALGNTLKAFKE